VAEDAKLPYKLLAVLLVAGLCWWVWRPLGAAYAVMSSGYARRPVVNNAPFWTRGVILVVGLLWGIGMAVAIRVIAGFATSSTLISVILYLVGAVAVGYVGYGPAAWDVHNKAGQTATVGQVSYLLATAGLVVLRGWVG
jgi:hypothetical protein